MLSTCPDPLRRTFSTRIRLKTALSSACRSTRVRWSWAPRKYSAVIAIRPTSRLAANGSTVYITGGFTGTVNFDANALGHALCLTARTAAPRFLLVLGSSSNGHVATAGQLATQGTNLAISAASGLVYVGTTDGYVAQFDANGSFIGMTQVGTGNTLVAADNAGNVWTDTNATHESILTELDSSFAVIWQRVLTSASAVVGDDLAIDGNDNLYLAGLQVGQSSYGAPGDLAIRHPEHSEQRVCQLRPRGQQRRQPPPGDRLEHDRYGRLGRRRDRSERFRNGGDRWLLHSAGQFRQHHPGNRGGAAAFVATLTSTVPPAPLFVVPLTPPPPTPPIFLGEHRMTLKIRRKSVVEFVLSFYFNAPLRSGAASYVVSEPGRTRIRSQVDQGRLGRLWARKGRRSRSVWRRYARKKPLTLKATGLVGADGASVAAVMTGL